MARGTLELHVDEVDVHVPRGSRWRDELTRVAVPLSTLREKLRGDEGLVTDEFGDSHPISVATWADHEAATRLLIWFTYQQRDAPEASAERLPGRRPRESASRRWPAAVT